MNYKLMNIKSALIKYAKSHGITCELQYDDVRRIVDIRFYDKSRNIAKGYSYDITDYPTDYIVERIIRDMDAKFFSGPKAIVTFSPAGTLRIKQVIFHEPATIVYWADGTRTVVKCQDGDIYDPEKGLAMAISKRALGNKGNYCEVFKRWLPEEEAETLEQRKIDAANKVVQNAFEIWQREHQKDVK